MAKIETQSRKMTSGARELLDEMKAGWMQSLSISNDVMQPVEDAKGVRLTDRRTRNNADPIGHISFVQLWKKCNKGKKGDQKEISCKFQGGELTEATDERLEALLEMEEQAQAAQIISKDRNGKDIIKYNENASPIVARQVNEEQLYKNQISFMCKLIEWGHYSKEDFNVEE